MPNKLLKLKKHKCPRCKMAVQPIYAVKVEDEYYHQRCFRKGL